MGNRLAGFIPALIPILVVLPMTTLASSPPTRGNPFLEEWRTPFGVPPFEKIKEEHFLPAFHEAIARQKQEVAEIDGNPDAPTFANTVEALERSGLLLQKVDDVFGNLVGAETNDRLQEINREVAPLLSVHRDDIVLDGKLFERIRAVWEARAGLGLDPVQDMLLERTWKRFVRGGAQLDAAGKERLRAVNSELATLGLRFADNVLQETNTYRLVIERPEDLAGLPDRVVATAAETAEQAGLKGRWVFTLHYPSMWPFLKNAENRELRRQIFTAYTMRGDHGDATDNNANLARMAALRAEKARLLGYETWADYVLEENMAKTPASVYAFLDRLWRAARAMAEREAATLQEAIRADGKDFTLEPHDWFYYSEKVRRRDYALDESVVRPYFPLEQVRDGAFEVAHRLYGITFKELKNVPVYHPEVKAFEVKDADGSHLAVFYTDFHPRPGKRAGAWSSRFRPTYRYDGEAVRPVVVNVCNFARPAGDTPALLSLDEVETLFHEFGHALHSILSQVPYRTLARTPRDFVELPSQIMENWATAPEVMKRYARHWKTGEPIPAELVEKIKKARLWNEGFRSTEYLAASLLDMDWHTLAVAAEPDPATFERISLARMKIPPQIVPRYRSTYFQHIFGRGGGYSSGYYSYIWAEVLDSDAFALFQEKGIFDPETARSFRTDILEKGGTEDALSLYVRFRGREPDVEPLLEKRGLK